MEASTSGSVLRPRKLLRVFRSCAQRHFASSVFIRNEASVLSALFRNLTPRKPPIFGREARTQIARWFFLQGRPIACRNPTIAGNRHIAKGKRPVNSGVYPWYPACFLDRMGTKHKQATSKFGSIRSLCWVLWVCAGRGAGLIMGWCNLELEILLHRSYRFLSPLLIVAARLCGRRSES